MTKPLEPGDWNLPPGSTIKINPKALPTPIAGTITVPARVPSPPVVPPAAGGGGVFSANDRTSKTPPGASIALSPLPMPGIGAPFTEPEHGTQITRLALGSHEYSQLQAWSSDGSLLLLHLDGVGHTVYRWPSMQPVISEAQAGGGWAGVRWIPGTRKLVFLAGAPARVMTLDVDTGVATAVATFAEPALRVAATQEECSEAGATIAWRHGGADGRELIMVVYLLDGRVGPPIERIELGTLPGAPTAEAVNWVAVSPLGKFVVIQWNSDGPGRGGHGIELFDISTGARGTFVRQLSQRHDHGDLGVSADGREYYVTQRQDGNATQNHNFPALWALWLDGAPPTEIRTMGWDFGHVSCRGPRGYAVVDGMCLNGGGPGEIGIVNTSTGTMLRLAFSRSTESTYWAQARSAISPDGRTVLFDSDWGVAGGPPSVYAIHVPALP